ncbi:MAG: hypothetical protein FJ123_00870 [Deltaproteobacteria bacterium]|nr:hypothetical protein [Deltaproteobacteria bacterium]
MADFYKPYPNEIYLVNTLIPFELEIVEKKKFKVFLDTIDYRNRCINYNVISSERMRFEEKGIYPSINVQDILRFIKQNWYSFENFVTNYFRPRHGQFITIFNNFKEKHLLSDEERIELHYHLVDLYHTFPLRSDKYLDGILMKVESQLATEDESDNRFKAVFIQVEEEDSEWTWMKFCNVKNEFMKIKTDESAYANKICANQETLKISNLKNTGDGSSQNLPGNNRERERIFNRYLFPLFYDPNFPGATYMPPVEMKKLPHYFVVVPIFSAPIDAKDYGTVLGHIYVPFDKPFENGTKWKKVVTANQELVNSLWNSWAPLAAQAILHGREHELLAQPIQYASDILKDFLSKITYLQDWEKVMLFRTREDKIPQYCFKRYPGEEKGGLEYAKLWDICEPSLKQATCEKCAECFDKFKSTSRGCKWDGKCYYIYDLSHITDPKVLPSIDDQDIIRYRGNILCFEFSDNTFFPGGGDENIAKLGDHYVQKLVPIFDRLLLKRNVLRHSIKSAVSSIISRNHSHHIGSHVTPRATVEKIRERLRKLGYRFNEKQEIKCVDLLRSRLDDYIQKKADFMAEIATEPVASTTRKGLREVIITFIQNTLLIDNIGANEGVNYRSSDGNLSNRLRIHFSVGDNLLIVSFGGGSKCHELNTHKYENCNYPYSGHCGCGPGDDSEHILQMESTLGAEKYISWPGPLGEFALYCFLENFIRNSIKHNHEKLQNLSAHPFLDVYINVKELKGDDETDEFYGIEVWDNLTIPKPSIPLCGERRAEREELSLIDFLSSLINQSIVEDDGKLRKVAWGIAEMKIMATLLRGSDDFMSMRRNLRLDIRTDNHGERLVYEFRLMKPKEVAIISPEQKPSPEKEKEDRGKGVWWFSSVEDYKEHVIRGRSPSSFNFAVVDKRIFGSDEIRKDLHLFPFRVLAEEGDNNLSTIPGAKLFKRKIAQISKVSAEEIIRMCWRDWLTEVFRTRYSQNVSLCLFFQQEKGIEPTKGWVSKANEFKKRTNEPLNLSIITTDEKDRIVPEIDSNNQLFLYDRHFEGYGVIRHHKLDKRAIAFHEAFDKSSSDFVPLFGGSTSDEIIYALAEAAALRVLIIDERISEVSFGRILADDAGSAKWLYGNGFVRLHAAKFAGIYIGTHFKVESREVKPLHLEVKDKFPRVCVKISTTSDKQSRGLKAYWCEGPCNECRSDQDIRPDILIIHQGVVDGPFKDFISALGGTSFSDSLRLFLEKAKESIPFVAIDSGRGIPANLPNDAKFLPFSLIGDYLMKDRFAKFSLVRAIMNLVRREAQ